MFQPGQSGNPGGRPKGYGTLREIARKHTDKAIQTLVEVVNDAGASPSARVAAANALLDRGWGRPEASLAVRQEGSSWAELMERLGKQPHTPAETSAEPPALNS